MLNQSQSEYKNRIQKTVQFINDNLDSELNLERISDQAYFSKFHFHRIFTSILNETPQDFVLRLRIEKAANYIMNNPSKNLTEISLDTGFSSQSVFARSFKKHFGVSATQFHEEYKKEQQENLLSKNCKANIDVGNYFDDTIFQSSNGGYSMNTTIKDMPELNLAYVANLEGYKEEKIRLSWDKLMMWAGPKGLLNQNTFFIGISFDNPDITPEDKCRSYACVTVPEGTKLNDGIGNLVLPAKRCAVLSFEGTTDKIKDAYKALYSEWLPSSGYEPDNEPCFEIYYKKPEDEPVGIMKMDICLPVKKL